MIITITLFSAGCEESRTSNGHAYTEIDSIQNAEKIETQVNSIEDSITCLDISFIESLESEWSSGYKSPKMMHKGYCRISSEIIENGKRIIYKNTLSNKLEISKLNYADGETAFIVEYFVDSKQLNCFEQGLKQARYMMDENQYRLQNDRYLKKGLGSYEKKTVLLDSNKKIVTYVHSVGKELSLPPIMYNNFDSIRLIDATNTN